MDDLFSYAARKARERQGEPEATGAAPEAERPLQKGAARSPAPVESRPAEPEPLTVTQVNSKARALLEGSFGGLAVVGELSGCKRGRGGHWYFTLKDENSQLPAVMFRREASRLVFEPEDGTEVVARGRLTLYAAYGRYQLSVSRLEPLGAGALQAAFEQLKAKLQAEGFFAEERKRALPVLPRRVAVVTSPTGAVIRDIIHVARRRFPMADILLVPTAVQGVESAGAIARALRRASRLGEAGKVDAVIVGRGGGSLEDLWGYNEEQVAAAIFECSVPVVSAVGHETDFTIADFVADVRAPTPSAAAEILFPVARELRAELRRGLDRGAQGLRRALTSQRHRLDAARHRMGDPRGAVREYAQSLDIQRHALDAALRARLVASRGRLDQLERGLQDHHPRVRLRELRAEFQRHETRCATAYRSRVSDGRNRLERLAARLHALSPLAVLERGYAIALDRNGEVVRRASRVSTGDSLELRLHEGQVTVTVEETNEP